MLQFTSSGAAKSGIASAQVVRCELADPSLLRELFDDVPRKFLSLIGSSEGTASLDTGTGKAPGEP